MEGSSPTPPQPPPAPATPQGGVPAGRQPVRAGAGGMAIAALILAIVGPLLYWCCGVGMIATIISFILALIERGNIEKGKSSRKGAGLVKAAIIIDIIGFALFVIGVIVYIVALAMGWLDPDGTYYYYQY